MADTPPPSARTFPKRQHRLISRVIEDWRHTGVISAETAEALRQSIVASSFDWKRLARYSFIVAIGCLVIAVAAVLADKFLIEVLKRLFSAPAVVKSLAFAALATAIFRLALSRRARFSHKVYSNEAVFFVGVLALATSIGFFGEAIDRGTGHYSILFLMASILYGMLGLAFPSKQVWVFGLLSLGAWMGTETGYMSGGGMYFLGMNYPLRFVLFGAILTGLGLECERMAAKRTAAPGSFLERLILVGPQTKVIGFLNLFIALWIMSIFGNYGDVEAWKKTPQYELFHWSVLFGAVAIVVVWHGLREDDPVSRGFGLTFLVINLYTRFFEYFWDTLHKALFFAVLAASFWYLGTKAEKIWHLGEARPDDR